MNRSPITPEKRRALEVVFAMFVLGYAYFAIRLTFHVLTTITAYTR